MNLTGDGEDPNWRLDGCDRKAMEELFKYHALAGPCVWYLGLPQSKTVKTADGKDSRRRRPQTAGTADGRDRRQQMAKTADGDDRRRRRPQTLELTDARAHRTTRGSKREYKLNFIENQE